MRISTINMNKLEMQPYLTDFSNFKQSVNLNQDRVTISNEGFQKYQQALFEKVFERLSITDKEKIIGLENEMEPLLESEEEGKITGEEQKKLDALFHSYDDIIIRNSDKATQKVLFENNCMEFK